jgi:hypothetical protein
MDNQNNSELVQALQGIHAELQRMNQTLANIAAKPAPRSAAPEGQGFSPSPRPYSSSAPRQYASPSRGGRPTGGSGSYSRTPRPSADGAAPYSRPARATSDGDAGGSSAEQGARYAAKKKSPIRPKGKLPAKKGSGYPKKAR